MKKINITISEKLTPKQIADAVKLIKARIKHIKNEDKKNKDKK